STTRRPSCPEAPVTRTVMGSPFDGCVGNNGRGGPPHSRRRAHPPPASRRWAREHGCMVTVGVVFHPAFEPEALPAYARHVEASGLDELWLWEDCFREGGVSTAAVALAVTERIRVATGVLPMPLRN